MKYFLLKGGFNWADEINFDGYNIIDEDTLNENKELLKEIKKYNESYYQICYIGTNEEKDIYASDVERELESAVELTNEEYEVLNRHITDVGKTCYSIFDFSCVEDYIAYQNKIKGQELLEAQKKENLKKSISDLQNFFKE